MIEQAELNTQIDQLGNDMNAILDKVETEKRSDLTPEEKVSFDKMDEKRDALRADLDRVKKIALLKSGGDRRTEATKPGHEESRGGRQQNNNNNNGGGRYTEEERMADNMGRAEALRGWFLSGKAGERTPEMRAKAEKYGISLDQREILIRLPSQSLRSLRPEDIDQWEKRYLGVDVISPDNGGHFAVPNEMMRPLEVALLSFGGMREVAQVIRTSTGGHLPIPTMNDTSNEGAIIGESVGPVPEQDPTLGQIGMDAYKYTSKKILMSVEFLQDNAINAAGLVGKLLGERIARITNRHFTVGTGSSQPRGIVVAATDSQVTTASPTALAYTELMDIEHSVDPAYRQSPTCRWMFADSTLKALKKIMVPQFSGDTAGYPLWRAGMATREPDTIDGYSYVINQHMPSAAGTKAIVFGDLGKYLIRDVRDITVVRLDELYAEYGQVAFLAFSRHDGDLLDAGTHPVKYATMHA